MTAAKGVTAVAIAILAIVIISALILAFSGNQVGEGFWQNCKSDPSEQPTCFAPQCDPIVTECLESVMPPSPYLSHLEQAYPGNPQMHPPVEPICPPQQQAHPLIAHHPVLPQVQQPAQHQHSLPCIQQLQPVHCHQSASATITPRPPCRPQICPSIQPAAPQCTPQPLPAPQVAYPCQCNCNEKEKMNDRDSRHHGRSKRRRKRGTDKKHSHSLKQRLPSCCDKNEENLVVLVEK